METEVIQNHLLYHKALIDDESDNSGRIEHYSELLDEVDKGLYISIVDPVERAIAAAFELIIEHGMDPWTIDILKFTNLYMKKIKDDDVIDFLTAGKLVKMAWDVLKLKSEDMLIKIEEEEEKEKEICDVEFDMPSNFMYDFDIVYEEPYDFDFNASVLEEPPFSEPVRRDETRPVALIELIDAFEEAKIEMELNRKIERNIKEKITLNLSEKIHKENLEEEINEVWNRLCDIEKEDILYSEVHNGTKEDAITVFLSLLFLASKRKVRLFQSDSYGDIHIELLIPEGLKKMEWEAVNVACIVS